MGSAPAGGKRVHLNFFETACRGNHECSGQWARPGDNSCTKGSLDYYINMAKLADKAKISVIFFADTYAGHAVYGGNMDAILRSGTQVAQLDPLVIISAMAAVTKSVSFGVTGSTSYIPPFPLARTFSTLDHLTKGRIAWNVVTSWSEAAADAFGKDLVPHDQRYEIAEEYMEVVYRLWNGSWADDSVKWNPSTRVAYDPARIKKINHKGQYFQMTGRHQVHPSPQRTPVLFQAGTSKIGSAFASKHAEAIFLNTFSPSQAAKVMSETRSAAAAIGRDPHSIKFFPCIMPIIGKTKEDAEEKYKKAVEYADPVAGLAQFCGYTGIDLAPYPLDEPMDLSNMSQAMAIQAVFKALSASQEELDQPWTPRRLGMRMALGGLHPCPVGTPEEVADVFEQWVAEADLDGFNIGSVTNPSSWEDVVDLLIPVLQRRGLYWLDYDVPGGTFRENLLGQKELREDHYGSSFKSP
ncbi:hypothetical protein M409DRAFT_71567 [Zasmidium cellare ATCC 36951]|uniref:Luciferase-like domain-containing protein n=1 Tax=Zasmidium cellare ATCC 36951 TaxID=1080233 RepID=A0A6A6BXC6_ZASCE|nr:uncharacterized protein M409DRAFT_71567 [Zasmidium cellare ATCC 36951]KAF2158590.1 hypothetical protein M409DRAFT_71567 [Zasmidium cellare ATCC 36951]